MTNKTYLDHDTETDLGGATLKVVNLARDEERELRGEALLEKHRRLAGRIKLTTESCHPEVVLGTDGSRRLSPATGEHDVEIGTDVDVRAEPLVVGGSEDAGHLVLECRGPLVERRRTRRGSERVRWDERRGVLGEQRLGRLRDARGRPLEDVLETKRETRGDTGKEGRNVDASSVGERGIDGLDREGFAGENELVLDLDHRMAGNGRELQMQVLCQYRPQEHATASRPREGHT